MKHEFEDGTVVELDSDVEVEDFLEADAEEGISAEDYAELVRECEEVEEVGDEDELPAGVPEGEL